MTGAQTGRGIKGPWRWLAALAVVALVTVGFGVLRRHGKVNAEWVAEGVAPWQPLPSFVQTIEVRPGRFQYLVNGEPQLFIGMGYNPIYRNLSEVQRAANYRRDFKMLCEAGVNHITGWDRDKGYDQDKFDGLTLDTANVYGIGVIMPIYLPPEGDYRDPAFVDELLETARAKVTRFRQHPAVRMWGLGNEVLTELPGGMRGPFGRAYVRIADLVHELDPNHPVIYREAETLFVPAIKLALENSQVERPWLLYGMNVYSFELERFLDEWRRNGLRRPLFVTEFAAEPASPGGRELGYLNMWRMIRAHPRHAMGGAPYVWTTEGPEPVDAKWGLVDGDSQPVDGTFAQLAEEWLREPVNQGRVCPS